MSDEEVISIMPDVSDCYQIVELWEKVGRCDLSGMQPAPITWSELCSFDRFNPISSFEADVIIEMSRCFVEGLNDKESRHPPSYEIMSDDERKQAIRSRVSAQFSALKANHNKEA